MRRVEATAFFVYMEIVRGGLGVNAVAFSNTFLSCAHAASFPWCLKVTRCPLSAPSWLVVFLPLEHFRDALISATPFISSADKKTQCGNSGRFG